MTDPDPAPRPFPRVPAHAWAWLQRSRPVLAEVAERLTGRPPTPGFVDELRAEVEADPFTRDVVVGVVAEVAFGGRVPTHRPPGASWDRGLTWWAAAIAGVPPEEFEARSRAGSGRQRALFEGPGVPGAQAPGLVDDPSPSGGAPPLQAVPTRPAPRAPSPERALVVRALRDLLAQSSGGQVPAAAVRQLLTQLEQT